MSEEYVPTTEEIRDYVEVGGEPRPWMPPEDELDAKRAAAFDRWLAAHDAEVRADGDPAEWEGIDTSQSPTLAAAKEAATFGIRLSSTEAAYIAEAVIAASGLRAAVPLTERNAGESQPQSTE